MGGHQNSRILLNWRWGRPEKPELSAQSQNSTMVGGGALSLPPEVPGFPYAVLLESVGLPAHLLALERLFGDHQLLSR